MFDSISLQPARNTTEIRKTLYGWRRKKKCHAGYNQKNALMYGTKYEFFLPPYYSHLIHVLFCEYLTIFHIEPYHNTANNTFQTKKVMF